VDGRTDVPKYGVRTDGRALSAVLLGLLGGGQSKNENYLHNANFVGCLQQKKPTQLLTISQSQFAVLVVRV